MNAHSSSSARLWVVGTVEALYRLRDEALMSAREWFFLVTAASPHEALAKTVERVGFDISPSEIDGER
ncbi:MAG: hypothetical protein ACOYOF_09240 [Verrucomicrobiaceae bacterium]